MNKAILVMDMPESCSECNLHKDGYCQSKLKYTYGRIDECRASFCPLCEVPQKKEVCGKYPQSDGITPSYKIGYNACLDEILKGAEENG